MGVRDINCPYCRKAQPLMAFVNDDKQNLVCYFCGKIVFGTSAEDGEPLKKLASSLAQPHWRKEPLPISMVTEPVAEPAVADEADCADEYGNMGFC